MNILLNNLIKKLKPYKFGKQSKNKKIIKLNTNENPFSPSYKTINSIFKKINKNLKLYPDPNCIKLKSIISKKFNIFKNQIFIGNGSDEILGHAFHIFFKNRFPILLPDITYNFYKSYTKLYNIKYYKISLNNIFNFEIKKYLKYNNKIGGIIFPNPNAPTGIFLKIFEIKKILKNFNKCLIIIDEAYIDFGGKSSIYLIKKYSNLLIIQTFSKSRSLAGLRIGFAIGNKKIILALEYIKNSFNSYPIDQLSLEGAYEAIKDKKYFNYTKFLIINNRQKLIKYLINLKFIILKSSTNFIFITHNKIKILKLFLFLKKNNIFTRYLNYKRIRNFLRITIGNKNEYKILYFFIKKYIYFFK